MTLNFTPVVYEHAARFVGRSPWEVSRDPELLFEAHRRAYLEYHQEVIAVGIDLYNLEAEAYGARVEPPVGMAVPAIHHPPLATVEAGLDLPAPDPARHGRLPLVLEVGRRLRREFPEADVRIPVAGPFSLAFNLRGINELCEDTIFQPEETARLLLRLAGNQAPFLRAIAAAGLGAACFESAAAPPMLSPAQFHALELPALRCLLSLAAEIFGRPVPCIVGGDTFPVLEDLLSTGTRYLACNAETDQAAFLRRVRQVDPPVTVRANLDPVLVAGHDRERLRAEVRRVRELLRDFPNGRMGTGCLPFETPPDNVHFIRRCLTEPDP